jgi:hypothetical protein
VYSAGRQAHTTSNTGELLLGGRPELADAFQEMPDMVADQVLRALSTGKGEIVVLNDEAHHRSSSG